MNKFTYEAKDEKGQLVRGLVQATNESAAEHVLQANHMIVLDLQPVKTPLSIMTLLNRIGVKDRAQFARQLATMIDAGLPLVQSLNIIMLQTKNPTMHTIISSLIRDVEGGYSFSSALAKHSNAFNQVFVSIVKSGEATGKLDEVLLELANQLEKDSSFSSKLRGAMAYPIFVIAAMIGVAILMMVTVIPTIKSVFADAGAQLPLATRILIASSDFMVSYWYIVVALVVLLTVGLRAGLKTKAGKEFMDRFELKAPIVSGTATSVIMARLTRTLGLLVSAGIPILESLDIVSNAIGNAVYMRGLQDVKAQVERGIPMSTPLIKNKDFPILFGQMVAVGEQTGRVDEMLGNLAKFYTDESETRLKGISTLIEPVVMVILGVGVAILIFAILVPIYNISSITQ